MLSFKELRCIVSGALVLATGCAIDDAGVDVFRPCTGQCIVRFTVVPHHLVIALGDTVRLGTLIETTGGLRVRPTYSTWDTALGVDSTGFVTTYGTGQSGVRDLASPNDAGGSFGGSIATIWVVKPDTSAQPMLALMRDAATGDSIGYMESLKGHDSVDVVISYVLGSTTTTAGAPEVLLRVTGQARDTTIGVPISVRGRGAFTTLRLDLTGTDAKGQRYFPDGSYDFQVMLPLADGRKLGDRTTYGFTICKRGDSC